MAHAIGVTVEGELGCLGSLETMRGDKEDGHGTEAHDDARAAADRPRAGRRLRQAAPSSMRWPSPSAPATAPTSSPASPPATSWRSTASRKSTPHPQHAPGDARLLQRAAGPAGHHPPVRRQDEGDLRRAGRGDPGGHQARRAQDQHRHRHPPGDDRRGAQVHGREPREVRRARLAQAGARGRQADLQAALPGVRLRRPGGEDQAAAAARSRQRYASAGRKRWPDPRQGAGLRPVPAAPADAAARRNSSAAPAGLGAAGRDVQRSSRVRASERR